jgi:hypothetical protein
VGASKIDIAIQADSQSGVGHVKTGVVPGDHLFQNDWILGKADIGKKKNECHGNQGVSHWWTITRIICATNQRTGLCLIW